MRARITELWRYPLKSCAGESVGELPLDAQGWPVGDRAWAIADARGELSWMGAHPRLTWVQARWLDGGGVHLEARDGSRCTLAGNVGRSVPITVWNEIQQRHDTLSAWDAGEPAAELLERVTGAPLRLVRLPETVRCREGQHALHLVSEASLDAWRDAWPAVRMRSRRVRANVVLGALDGQPLPAFLEERLRQLDAPQARLHGRAPCLRCIVPSVDPASAQLDESATATLTRLSAARAPGQATRFGVYAQGEAAGVLRVGDEVELQLR